MKPVYFNIKPVSLILSMVVTIQVFAQTEILKWPGGKQACVTLTYDDGSRNQFEIAIPLMDKYNFKGTFFINTGAFAGSENQPSFVGRPIMEIINESKVIPTNHENVFERTSMIRYLAEIQKVNELSSFDMYSTGSNLERGRFPEVFKTVDKMCKMLVESKKTFNVRFPNKSGNQGKTTWEDLKRFADNGHEFANHTVSHPHLSNMDKANILYEIVKCRDDIEKHLGIKHTLSLECPYGIHDGRVMEIAFGQAPFLRNRTPEDFFDEILRSDPRPPGKTNKEYIHWQRGPLSNTPFATMTDWVDTSIFYKTWLVLVFHGVEGIGWEALPAQTLYNYFNYIRSKENSIWVATFQDAYKYIRERMNTRITESVSNENIIINIKNTLESDLVYNMPLTLKTTLPNDWDLITIEQGKTSITIKPVTEEGKNIAMYDVVPNYNPVVLSKAKK